MLNSIAFPDMFNSNSTNVVKDKQASKQDLFLLLKSEKGDLFGDPFFGVRLKKYLFDQNNYILKSLIIDEIFTQIRTFCPQIYVERKDIKIKQEGTRIIASIRAMNRVDYTTDTYNLVLLDEKEGYQ